MGQIKESIKWQNQAKNKNLGTDILYRIIMAAMAVCVPIVAYFGNLVYTVIESDIYKLVAKLKGDSSDDGTSYDYWSIKRVVSLVHDGSGDKGSLSSIWDALSPVHGALLGTLIFFAIALLLAVVIFFFALISKKKIPQLIISIVGLVSVIGMLICFKSIAAAIVNGTITIADFLSGVSGLFGSAVITQIIPYIAKFTVVQVSSGWFMLLFLYIGMIVWSGSYVLIESGEKSKASKQSVNKNRARFSAAQLTKNRELSSQTIAPLFFYIVIAKAFVKC